MACIEVTADTLTVHVEGFDKVWALKSRLDVPLEHVVRASMDPDLLQRIPKGLRLPGTYVPKILTAGSYYQPGSSENAGWSFWDVHDLGKAIVIELASDHYKWMVVQVDDPPAAVATIEHALQRR